MASTTRAELPGGPADRKPMHFYFLLDGSTSMQLNAKIQALNFAVAEAIPAMRRAADSEAGVRLMVQALRFATNAEWVVGQPTPIAEFQWRDIEANGDTAMGKALTAVVDELDKIDTSRKYLPPVIVLVTDGRNTDGKLFDDAMQRLMTHPVGRKSKRLAVAIGADADVDALRAFIGNEKIPVFEASNADSLAEYIEFVSTSAIKISSQPSTDLDRQMAEAPRTGSISKEW